MRQGPYRLEPNSRAEAAQRRRTHRDLLRAIEHEAFTLRFQPILSLRHGTVVGAEALLFWPHPRQGLIPAKSFLREVEPTLRIGAWHLTQSCGAVAAGLPWPDHWTVSVRISWQQLAKGVLLRQVAHALEHSGLSPDRLEIRLGEANLDDIDVDTLLTLSALRDLGVGLALDDFGTGFASLAMLKRLPLTAMKLDRSLIRDLPSDREDAAILRAIVTAGHALGLDIVADGIDTESQRAFLSASGCDIGQGALFSQHLTAAQLTGWIAMT